MPEEEICLNAISSSKNYYNISPDCIWIDVFTNEERRYYHAGMFWTSLVSLIATSWLNKALIQTTLWKDVDYRYLTLFTVPTSIRWFLLALSRFFDQTIKSTCVFFAYVDSFFGMLEIEGLTHACIARFVMARYAAKGWTMNKRLWEYFMYDTIAFAVFYTFLPLTGYGGSYDYDFTCTTCSYNMILPNTSDRYFIMLLFFLRYIKPVCLMIFMVSRAIYLECCICTDAGKAARITITWMMVHVIFMFVQGSGFISSLKFYTIAIQLGYMKHDDISREFINGENWIEWTYWFHAICPLYMVLVMMRKDEKILHNMLYHTPCCGSPPFKWHSEARAAALKRGNKDED